MSSALIKVPQGAWFTITLASILAFLLILWRFGKEQQWAAEAEDRFPTTQLVRRGEHGIIKLTEKYGGDDLSVIKGFGIFFDKAGETTPAVFTHFLSKLIAAPDVRQPGPDCIFSANDVLGYGVLSSPTSGNSICRS